MNIQSLTCIALLSMLLSSCDQPLPLSENTEETSLAENISAKLGATSDSATENTSIDTANSIAIINGKAISRELLIVYQKVRDLQQPSNNGRMSDKDALNELINMQLLVQKAEQENLHKAPGIASLISLQRDGIIAERAMNNIIRSNAITNEMIEAEYQTQYLSKPRMEYSARHILVKEKASAEEIIRQLQQGADFSQLAKETSTGPSAPYGGELEWFTLDSVVPEFGTAIAQLDKGQITSGPVETRYGWHVIQLHDKRDIPPPELEQVRDAIVSELQSSIMETAIDELRSNADIQILKQGTGVETVN